MNGTPSRMDATAKMVEGETSSWEALIELSRASAVSFTPGMISAYRSVLAVQRTIRLSSSLSALNLRMSFRRCSRWAALSSPGMRLSARSAWLAAMKSGSVV